MAIMHPSDESTIIFPNKSEKEIYYQLRDQLKPRVHVFYSVQWQTQEHGKSKMGEADFIIVDPDNGILVLEAKGGFRIEHTGAGWRIWDSSSVDSIRPLKESPYDQARKSMFDLVKYYAQTQNRKMSFTYAYAVIFPFYNVPDNLCVQRCEDNTIQFSDMSDLRKKINHVFFAYRQPSSNMTQDDYDRVIKMLAGCAASRPPVGAYYQRSVSELSGSVAIQDVVLSLLHNYDQAIIAGSAGTGKTYMAMTKAEEYASQNLKTLYVCYNRLNAQKVKEYLLGIGVSVDAMDFYQLIKREVGAGVYTKRYTEDKSLSWVYSVISQKSCTQYDAIIVDEAQDFSEEWALTLRTCFMKDEKASKLFVFYDEDQNIFQRNFGEAFLVPHPPFLLRMNLRNTRPIWDWLKQATTMGTQCFANEAAGLNPETYRARNQNLAINWVEKKVRELIENGIKPSEIVFLSNVQYQNTCLASIGGIADIPLIDITSEEAYDNCISFCTIQAYKGLESPVVICLEKGTEMDAKTRYVAYSRARCLLYVVQY